MNKLDIIVHGCECTQYCSVHPIRDSNTAPIIRMVMRNDELRYVCSYCTLKGDTILHEFKVSDEHLNYDPDIFQEGLLI